MRKKRTVRESLHHLLLENIKNESTNRLQGRYLFKATVRLIFEYLEWLQEEPFNNGEDTVGGDLSLIGAKKLNERDLSIQDRSVLFINPKLRTKKDKVYILELLKKLQAFKKYPNERESLAEVCYYRYFGPDRVIVKQNHPAHYLYYIINGNVELTKVEKNNLTGEIANINAGLLGPGDMFGEIALLYSTPRSTTVTSKTPVDLICLHKSDFDRLLKALLLENWNILQDAFITFNYFKSWDKTTIRECCILSKIKDIKPQEVVLGDGKGMVNYVYFLLSGTCQLIEHILITKEDNGTHIIHKLYNPEKKVTSKSPKFSIAKTDTHQLQPHYSNVDTSQVISEVTDFTKEILNKKIQNPMDIERISTVTTTLQEIVGQWHEISDVAAALTQQPSSFSQQFYPNNVQIIFMKICEFHRGACFGLGEDMQNRRIVTMTPVRCLLIPRYWLSEHNHANIWERVKVFMNSKYPSRKKLFNEFITNRKWMNYKKSFTDEIIIKKCKDIINNTTIHDVPYSIRINQIFD